MHKNIANGLSRKLFTVMLSSRKKVQRRSVDGAFAQYNARATRSVQAKVTVDGHEFSYSFTGPKIIIDARTHFP